MNGLPYAINNLFGDPSIQLGNTYEKLDLLRDDPWTGPVGLISKGYWSKNKTRAIKQIAPKQLVVFISISALCEGEEKVSVEKRLQSITNFACAGIPVIGYARPLTDIYRTRELITQMRSHGANAVVVSGFRGTPEMGKLVGISNPSIRVKEMPTEIGRLLSDMGVFFRTSCGAAYVLGLRRSWNPYWKAPQLAGCFKCPLKRTCYDDPNVMGSDIGFEILTKLGYRYNQQPNLGNKCDVLPENRRKCKSCCTTCYLHTDYSIELSRQDKRLPTLGELSFARHILGGVSVHHKAVYDDGSPFVGKVDPPNPFPFSNRIRVLNTWFTYSNQIKKCYGCSYCFAPFYQNDLGEYGVLPSEIMRMENTHICIHRNELT